MYKRQLYGLYQVLARNLGLPLAYLPYLHGEPLPWSLQWGLGFAGYVRPSSFLGEPTYLGRYLVGPLLIVATLVFTKRDKVWLFKHHRLNYGVLLILTAALIASFALAAYFTLAFCILIVMLLDRRNCRFVFRFILTLVVVLVLLTALLQVFNVPLLQGVEKRLQRVPVTVMLGTKKGEDMDPSINTRLQEAALSLNVWLHHPFVGIGLNQLQFIGRLYAPPDFSTWIVELGHIHNIWLEVLVQLGAVGLLFFVLMWLRALRMMRTVFRYGSEPMRCIGLALSYVLFAAMIYGFEGGPFTFPLYWFYLGMASIIHKLGREEIRRVSEQSFMSKGLRIKGTQRGERCGS